ncbi:MAG: FtsB family cell division protein [Cyclonatronaceae bacterium]
MPTTESKRKRPGRLSVLNPLRWRTSFLLGVFVLFALLWFSFVDRYSLYARYQISQEKAAVEQRIEQLERETRQLEAQIESIKKQPLFFERIAREEYGMRRESEVIYHINEEEL